MKNITILFDVIIALLSLWVLFKLLGYGGIIGKSLSIIGYGIIIIGLSQFVETFGLILFTTNLIIIEIIHRFILTIGFIFIAWGFKNLMTKK